MKKVIAIGCADLHLHNWEMDNYPPQFRLMQANEAILEMFSVAKYNKCPILFSGDFIHNPKYIDNITFNNLMALIRKIDTNYYPNTRIYAISGNHDQSEPNTINNASPSYLNNLEGVFKCFSNAEYTAHNITDKIQVIGIPYLTGNVGLKEKILEVKKVVKNPKRTILMLHSDLPGAKESDGREVGTVENFEGVLELLKEFGLVISGHIHRPQQLGPNIYMLGAMNHQKTSDEGCKMGYWKIYKDFSMEFVRLRLPEFKTVKVIPENNLSHYWIKKEESVVESVEKSDIVVDFSTSKKKISLVKTYLTKKGIKSKSKKNILIKVIKASSK